ncbi:MAG: ureidoglycolate lyase [Halioglobus sp.]
MNTQLKPLTAEAFKPYGDVIEVSADNQVIPINYGLTDRHHNLANVDVSDNDGKAIISIFRSQPIALPFEVRIMERHPLGSQAFMPLGDKAYVVVVAPAGEFHPDAIEAFLARPDQGVNYHKGTWHHYCLVLESESSFLVIDRGGEGNNCDEVTLENSTSIYIENQETGAD